MSEYPNRISVGLIGDKLTHSHSPIIHNILGNPYYGLHELKSEELDDFFAKAEFDAINVTIPYKKDVIKYCESISSIARLCNSVNTVLNRNGKLYGYNTDFIGFIAMLKYYEVAISGKSCVVLGSGGAGGTAVEALKLLGAKRVITVSRSGEYNYENIAELTDTEILVNSTPVGLYGRNNDMPVDPKIFPKLDAVVDLIANPYRTELMNRAQRLGIKTAGGDAMLFAQAVAGDALFFDKKIDYSDFELGYTKYRKEGNNIIIIGMPGSGKSTVGNLISQKYGMRFLDTDTAIEEKTSMSIPDIFSRYGEAHFRSIETEVLNDACNNNGYVIVTGGGVVESKDNRERMRRTGMVFCLTRPLEKLISNGRPVSLRDGVEAIYSRRKPLYDECSDHNIKNISPQQCCDEIIDIFNDKGNKKILNLSEFTKLV